MKALFNDHALPRRARPLRRQLDQLGPHRRAGRLLLHGGRRARRAAPAGLLLGADRQFRRRPRRLRRQAHGPADRAAGRRDQRQRHPGPHARRPARYEVRGVVPTTSPSMDIQVSSNFERLLFEAHGRDAARRPPADGRRSASPARFDDRADGARSASAASSTPAPADEAEVAAEIARRWREAGYLLDPHTAIGVARRAQALARDPATPMVVLGTAHPAKFPDAVEAATRRAPAAAGPSRRPDGRARSGSPCCRTTSGAIEAFVRAAGAAGRQRSGRMRPTGRAAPDASTITMQSPRSPTGSRVVTRRMPHLETASLGVWVGAGARARAPRASTASRICSSTWPSRAPRGAPRARSPRRSRASAATSTPRPASSTPPITPACSARTSPLALDILADILTEPALRRATS